MNGWGYNCLEIDGWKYYNHAAIPTCAPHEKPNLQPIISGSIWRSFNNILLARWTSDYDCGHETNWWYIVKDSPLDLMQLKAKRRYEINKGIRNFDVRIINPNDYPDDLFRVTTAAYTAWPDKYRPNIEKERFLKSIDRWNGYEVYGAFSRDSGDLCAYGMLQKASKWADFIVLRADPSYEKQAVNAATVYGILKHCEAFLADGGCICDGARSINHETAFQDYLEKYFGFRRAYCKLHLRFRPGIGFVIVLLSPLKHWLRKFDNIGIIHKINGVLLMKEFAQH